MHTRSMDPFLPFPADLATPAPHIAGHDAVVATAQAAKAQLALGEPDSHEQGQRRAAIDLAVAANRILEASEGVSEISFGWTAPTPETARAKGYLVHGRDIVEFEEGRPQATSVRALPSSTRAAVQGFLRDWKTISTAMPEDQKRWILNEVFTRPLVPGQALNIIQANTPPAPARAPTLPAPKKPRP